MPACGMSVLFFSSAITTAGTRKPRTASARKNARVAKRRLPRRCECSTEPIPPPAREVRRGADAARAAAHGDEEHAQAEEDEEEDEEQRAHAAAKSTRS